MDLGKLNQRVTLLRYTEVEQVGGSATYPTYTTVASVWALIKPMKGLVRFDTKQIGEEITHRIIIRYYPNTSTLWWIRYKDRLFRIRSVSNLDEANRYLELMCREASDVDDSFLAGIDGVGDSI